jgi:hypothetical protein
MRCARCGSESPAGKNFCGDCGAELSNRCPSCAAVISDSWKFCRDCGAALSIAATAPEHLGAPLTADPDSAGELEGERPTVTAPLADPFAAINGSTNVTDLDPLPSRRWSARHGSKFVGREGELAQMNHALELARCGQGQIVAAVGEAGIGKSRLFHEFKSASQSGWMVLEAFSVPHGKTSAYLPVIDLLKNYLEIIVYGRVERKGRWQSPDTGDAVPNLFGLLGVAEGKDTVGYVDAQAKKRRTLDAIKRIVLRESLNQPLMLIFEDLQWIDEETQALLNLLADSVATSKLLLIVSYRPEYSHHWGDKSYYTELRLDPLRIESADEMLSALVGISDDLNPLKRLIIEQTKGNPFFIEESVQMLLDERTLVTNGSLKLTKPVSELKIPRTLEAILASRVERLPLDEKELLQTIAAIGREFAFSVLKGVVAKSDGELERMLADLQIREFIHEQSTSDDIEYAFKHALTQEAAYISRPFERRKLLHGRIGAVLEASFARTLDDHLGELAHHYGRSSNAGKAVEYLDRAGKQAVTRGALKEARIHFKRAIAALGSTSGTTERMQREFDLQLALVEVLLSMSGPVTDEDSTEIKRLQELAEKIGNPGHLMSALMAAWTPWTEFSALMAAWTPKQEFKFREEEVPNSAPARMPPALSWEFYLGKFESARPETRRDLAAFSAVTVLLLVSLIILYQGGMGEEVQSLLKTTFG